MTQSNIKFEIELQKLVVYLRFTRPKKVTIKGLKRLIDHYAKTTIYTKNDILNLIRIRVYNNLPIRLKNTI